jgi:hypothetical protein
MYYIVRGMFVLAFWAVLISVALMWWGAIIIGAIGFAAIILAFKTIKALFRIRLKK